MPKKFFLILAVCIFVLSGCEATTVGAITTKGATSEYRAEAEPVLLQPDPHSVWRHGQPEEHGLNSAALPNLHRTLARTKVRCRFGRENLFRPTGMSSVTFGTNAQGVDANGSGVYWQTVNDIVNACH